MTKISKILSKTEAAQPGVHKGKIVRVKVSMGMATYTLDNGYSFDGSPDKYKEGDEVEVTKFVSGTVQVKKVGEAKQSSYEWDGKFRGEKVHAVFKVHDLGMKGTTHSGGPDDSELPDLELESVVDEQDRELHVTAQEKEHLETQAAEDYFEELYHEERD